ncbi:cupin domain-containing protein [Rubellimicrobium sp. CFH 75288]|uniref:cupin domain-containing protein n=1 Tax=Rubellimicrobium sp. CFH 75288 TaxID=2697034 RepID=UPI001411C654|nr:cupin domain-containing protein [Rubellimicrobium sp. CFH 75288]NAZ37104.1 cupin domain-containing protein [Rubellimicrobium sp. CFH 75288]
MTADPFPIRAEVRLPTTDLRADLPFFTRTLRMRLDTIYPADDPAVAVLSGHGLRIRLERGEGTPGLLRVLTDDPSFAGGERALVAPGGTRVEVDALDPPLVLPETRHAFVVRRLADGAPWVIGRAGMHYRDLVPGRLGGAMIASHIRIPDGGPVPDSVHFHKVGFQLIFCVRGWVDVVYEDQGGPRRLNAGDCFIQPPEIRHRVLEASDGIEVVEIGVPADHVTEIDHEMTLPTPHLRPEREWKGQRFVHNRAEGAAWEPFRLAGWEARDTTIAANTRGLAGVRVARPRATGAEAPWSVHDADILFGFVLAGGFTLRGEGKAPFRLGAGDAFVIPPGLATRWDAPETDCEILEVSLPGAFATRAVEAPDEG